MMNRGGQVALYLLMVLVAIFLLSLLNVDTFVAVRGKNRVQNAGDAAALAAARKQGSLLNEIGRLNLEHIVAAIDNDSNQCERIVMDQRRLALLGPVEALRFANEAAMKNGMVKRSEFSKILEEHVEVIRTVYSGGDEDGEGTDPYPAPWKGAWGEYASAIENVIADGLATGPDNVEFYYDAGGHLLLNRSFYHAIAGYNWCWFHWNAEQWLKDYDSYHDWPPLPLTTENSFDNSEIFGLHVQAWKGALTDILDTNEIARIYSRYGSGELSAEKMADSYILTDRGQVWFLFDSAGVGKWGRWFNGLRLAEDEWEDSGEFPIVGEIKPEYNVRGCAAICRCIVDVKSFAVEAESTVNWSAAAKPFGTVENLDGETDVVTSLRRFIVPCFEAVRLVALDSVGGENLATADYGWVNHVRHHLADYLLKGPFGRSSEGCFYCLMLENWEHDSFRGSGISWLKYNANTCIRPTGGGPAHGGTSHGH